MTNQLILDNQIQWSICQGLCVLITVILLFLIGLGFTPIRKRFGWLASPQKEQRFTVGEMHLRDIWHLYRTTGKKKDADGDSDLAVFPFVNGYKI